MKKFYLLLALSLFIFSNASAQQNVVTGSDMEDESAWTVTQITTDYPATTTFGYTDETPSAGSGGALRVECSNEANQGTNVIIWQEVDLLAGHQYVLDAAFKGDITPESFWAQWVVESNSTLPTEGSDYSAEDQAHAQINSWNGDVSDWNLDITLQTWEFENGAQSDTVVVEEDGTYVFGVKIGIWYGEQLSYEVIIDDMTLTDIDATGTAVKTSSLATMNVFPNPANSFINVQSSNKFDAARILNVSGQEVMRVQNRTSTIDVSSLNNGVFVLELLNDNKPVSRSRFIKQ